LYRTLSDLATIAEINHLKPKIFFPGLNELRALAAIIVIAGHIESMKAYLGFPSKDWSPIPGILGVVLFFTLSGFLITTLLLNEIAYSSKVNIRNFYVRRVLRIWPLYFLVIGISILIFNKISIFQIPDVTQAFYDSLDIRTLGLFLLVLPNFVSIDIPYAGQIWSIGVEQQFYFVQPLIVNFVRNKHLLIAVLGGLIFSKEALVFIENRLDISINSIFVHQSSSYGLLAIGCLGAVLFDLYPQFVKKYLHNTFTQIMSVCAFIIFIVVINVTGQELVVDLRYHALVFIIIILNAATNPSSFLNLKSKVLDYLGQISYGIYMYHAMAMAVAIRIADYFVEPFENVAIFNLLVYFFTIAITLLVSALSYRYFETFFLERKKRF
jgi:peptidoglycan/LPS O-acetylase OafA/YrhL